MNFRHSLAVASTLVLLASACGDDGPTEPNLTRGQVAGTYNMAELKFDPQGTLPQVDILSRLEVQNQPTLQLTEDGEAQLVFRNPATNLVMTVNGSFSTTPTGVRVDLGGGDTYRTLLLSRRMTYDFSGQTATLAFASEAPDGVQRDRLLDLVPEFEGEQLLDPVPGTLRVIFQLPGS